MSTSPKFRGECALDPFISDFIPGPILGEGIFAYLLSLERKRSNRSGRPFLLALIRLSQAFIPEASNGNAGRMDAISRLKKSIRDTDLIGWYLKDDTLGVIFNEVDASRGELTEQIIRQKIVSAFRESKVNQASIQKLVSLHWYPEHPEKATRSETLDIVFYPEVGIRNSALKRHLLFKRAADLCVSTALLVVLSPLFLLIALLVKLTSPGPILFKQRRLEQFSRPFTFLKFRSMYYTADERAHREYVDRFINHYRAEADPALMQDGFYKMKRDPRMTPLGRILRKTSLDELPQLINVLKGEMSLVGPRPPIPYEFEQYESWHRDRLLVKPGITGLWQVSGRSRTTFKEMVRLDLKYIRDYSLWMDLAILLRTPLAVFKGECA